ncbi:MAG: radical SAM protein [Spirochaetaceae bacterium]|nr:radical SAM protein [Spirochaetaceae bacterium]
MAGAVIQTKCAASLAEYLNGAVNYIVRYAFKAALKSPKELLFIMRYAVMQRRMAKIRRSFEAHGEHIPLFLIASITSQCNLRCAGCYHHALRPDTEARDVELSAKEWGRIFDEARELGIPFILLAGGEPLFRDDVLREAARRKGILFPVFTNGTMIDEARFALFDRYRALIPVLSLEGAKLHTDERRGGGVHDAVWNVCTALYAQRIPFGLSITVTKENAVQVTGRQFITEARQRGCAFIVYVEYIPADGKVSTSALSESERAAFSLCIEQARTENMGFLILSFPGDEKESGGCLAAGRGFFHINAAGAAEPCPFSPYSDMSLRSTPLRAALKSPFFAALNSGGFLRAAHNGPCHLSEVRTEVARLAENFAAVPHVS